MIKFIKLLAEKIKEKVTNLFPKPYIAYDMPALEGLTPQLELVLAKYNPLLLQQFQQVVLPAAKRAIAEKEKLDEMVANYQPQIVTCSAEKATLTAIVEGVYAVEMSNHKPPKELRSKKPDRNKLSDILVNVGLSFMLFLGIAHYLEIKIKSIVLEQLPLLVIAIITAIGITIGTKKSITAWVVETRSNEPVRSFPHNIAFWERLRDGDILSFMSVGIPGLEMMFAAPGLIDLLPMDKADNFLWCLSTFMVAGLAATVNVSLAWGQAWQEIRQNQGQQTSLDEWKVKENSFALAKQARDANPHYQKSCQRLEELTATIEQLQEAIAVQTSIANSQWEWAKMEFEQWQRTLERWCQRNRRLIAEPLE